MTEKTEPAPPNLTRPTPRDFLNSIQKIAHDFKIVSLNRQIEACEALLGKDRLIDIAILGQFKAGKSSFINSLVGRPVLPVGVIPVTTVITRLHYGPVERAMVSHFGGASSEIGLEEGELHIGGKEPGQRTQRRGGRH